VTEPDGETLDTRVRFDAEETARSLHRLAEACCGAISGGPPEDFDRLGYAEQMPWFSLARRAPRLLESMENRSFAEAGAALASLFEAFLEMDPSAPERPPAAGLLWETLARHLLCVLDCDESPALEESEGVMLVWFKRQLEAR